jgi:hypothetical protein
VILRVDDHPLRSATAPPHDSGFATGIVIGLAVGIAIGWAIARRQSSMPHSERKRP